MGYTRDMSSTSKYPYKRLIQLDNAMKAAIRDFRFEHKLMSDAEAIRQLVDAGLEARNGREEREAKRGARR